MDYEYYYIYPDCPNNPEAYKLEKPHECETGVDYTPIDSRDCFCDRLCRLREDCCDDVMDVCPHFFTQGKRYISTIYSIDHHGSANQNLITRQGGIRSR